MVVWVALGFVGAQLAVAGARVVLVAGWWTGGAGQAVEGVISLVLAAGLGVAVHREHGPAVAVGACALGAGLQLAVSHASIAIARAVHLGDEDVPLPPEHPLAVLVLAALVALPAGGSVDGARDIYVAVLAFTVTVGALLGFAAPRAGLEPAHPAVLHPLGLVLGGGVQLACAARFGAAIALVTAVSLSALSAGLLALGWGLAARRGALAEDPGVLALRCLVYGGLGCFAAGALVVARIWILV